MEKFEKVRTSLLRVLFRFFSIMLRFLWIYNLGLFPQLFTLKLDHVF